MIETIIRCDGCGYRIPIGAWLKKTRIREIVHQSGWWTGTVLGKETIYCSRCASRFGKAVR